MNEYDFESIGTCEIPHKSNWINHFPNTGMSFHYAKRHKRALANKQKICSECHKPFLEGEKLTILYDGKSREFISVTHKVCP